MQFASSPRTQSIVLALALGCWAGFISFASDNYTILILTLVPIWAVMGLSWNLLGGYLGLVSFGQAAFFGIGAFTVVILAHDYNITPWIGLPLAAILGGVAGIIIGAITFRFRGFYFSLAMLAYPLALLNVFEWAGWSEVAIPMHREAPWTYMQFEDPRILSWMALGLFGIAMAISLGIERSRFGLFLFAIRQDEIAARMAGIPAFANKLKTIAISGALAGCAGGLYALVLLVVTPVSVFGMLVSAQAIIISMFGGRGTAWGAAIGAVILVPLSEWLHGHFGAALPGIAGIVFGLAIILVVLLIPNGIYWALQDWFRSMRGAAEPKAPPAPQALVAQAPTSSDAQNSIPQIGAPLLKIDGINIAFGGVKALQNVSFDIKPNEILGIIGPNGAGKTTLFNVLSGLVHANSGQVTFRDGSNLIGRTPEEICKLGIGRTFQTVRVFKRLTLLENVVAGAFVRFASNDDALRETWAVLERLGLSDRAESMGSELNNRELRLMELARTLVGKPKLVLLDECLAGLSSEDITHLMKTLRRLQGEGITVAIIEHTMDAMVKLVDRMVVMDHGTVLVSGVPSDVLKTPEVITAYLGKRWAQHAQN